MLGSPWRRPATSDTIDRMAHNGVAAPVEGKAAEWADLATLKPWAKNPRKNEQTIDRVVASIKQFGFGAPLLARKKTREIIAGHTRALAAEKLGMKRVPVRFLDLTEKQAHALAIADNKIPEYSQWDDHLLPEVLGEFREDIPLFEATGFSYNEYFGEPASQGPTIVEDEVPLDKAKELQKKWGTERGQLWHCDGHRIMVGDSTNATDFALLMAGEKASWMWTDPPYGVDLVAGNRLIPSSKRLKMGKMAVINDDSKGLPMLLKATFHNVDQALKDGASIYVAHTAGANLHVFLNEYFGIGWHMQEDLVWAKDRFVLSRFDYQPQHEGIIYGWKGKNRTWIGNRSTPSIFNIPRPQKSDQHPTMKPVTLVAACLANSAKEGTVGVEPFCGSGTTLVAAQQMGKRRVFAMEIGPQYAAVAIERLAVLGVKPELNKKRK